MTNTRNSETAVPLRWGVVVAMALVAAGYVAVDRAVVSIGGDRHRGSTKRYGATALDFEITDVNPRSRTHGQTLRLSRVYAGGGALVNFMASWCGPCRSELETLEEIHLSGLAPVVCVAASEVADSEGLLRMAERLQLTLPILYATPEQAAGLQRSYGHTVIPSTYLIDSAGAIRTVIEGTASKPVLEREIRRQLSGAVRASGSANLVQPHPPSQPR